MRIRFGLIFLLLGAPVLACPGCWKAAGNGWQVPQDPGGMQVEAPRRLPEGKTEPPGTKEKGPDKSAADKQPLPVATPAPPVAPETPR